MIKVIENLKTPMPIFLEDCIVSFIELQDKTLRFTFEDKDLSYQNKQSAIKNLEVSFLLPENFLDENFVPPVRMLKFNRRYNRSVVRYWILKDFIEFIHKGNYKLKFYATYYNEKKSLLIFQLMQNGVLQDRVECDIELSVESIVYKWD